MASLALGVAGAALGSAFGPLGASIGWTLGSALGSALFPEKVQGPRLTDLRIQTSSYGKMNPLLYGTMRVAGNVIWIGNGGELVEHEETSGGKGGPETTSYTYSASFAIRLVDVEIAGIGKVWWNGRLVRTREAAGDLPLTIYLGTEDQLPDPTMEADLGTGNVPAYRGVAYVVFTDMFLTDGGNSIGNWEFECFTTVGDIPIRVSTFDTTTQAEGGVLSGVTFDPDTQIITIASYRQDNFTYHVRQYELDGTSTGISVDAAIPGAFNVYGRVKNLDVAAVATGPSDAFWYIGNTATQQILTQWPTPLVQYGLYQNGHIYFPVASPDGISRFPAPDGIPAGSGDVFAAIPGSSGNLTINGSNIGKIYVHNSSTDYVYEYDEDLTLTQTWEPADFPSSGSGSYGSGGFFRFGDFFATNFEAVGAERMNLLTISADDVLSLYPQERDGTDFPAFGWTSGNIIQLDGGYVLGRDGVVLLVAPLEGVPLSEIVADISDRCGLDAAEIDVTELTDIVDGYLIDQQTSGRDMIQPLRDAYFFDGVEIDDKVAFVKRNADSIVTIAADELAAHVDGETPTPVVGIARTQEVDLPQKVTVSYVNAAADYQAGSQISQRQVTQSQSSVSLALQISMNDQKAKSVADTHVLLPWVERNRFTAFASRKYAKYTPTDVITVAGHKMRVIDKNESVPGVIKFDGVAALAPVLIPAGIPVSNPIFTSTPSTPAGSGVAAPTLLYLLDLPLVSDSDDPSGVYAAMRGAETPWPGAAVFKSVDGGSNYSSLGSTSTAAVMGTAMTALGDWSGGNMFDESHTITVVVGSGQTLSSVTETAVLNGANEAALGDEVIQFKNAELIDDDTYELSGLLRGRLGTEWATGTHAIGDRFTLLPVLRVASEFSELNLELDYKGVTFGKTLGSTTSQEFTNTGRAWKPYSPKLLGGGTDGDGDVLLHWTRRTRRGGGAWTSVDVPIGEESEQYAVQIFNSDYSLCARVEFIGGAQSYTYTAADQVADFGATQQTIFFSVGQIGFANIGTQTRGTAPGAGSTNDDPLVPTIPLE
jgi:hypothetical protein